MVKVNEKPTVPPHGFGPPSSLSSDGSFVVLERSPPQHERSGQFTSRGPERSIPHLPMNNVLSSGLPPTEGQLHNSTYMSGSMPSDLSPEEIQKKLHDVLQENVELKETLHQNNLAMKQQFNTLVMWQEEVFKVHQNHKEKFTETRDLILKLRAENAEMKTFIEETKNGETALISPILNQLKSENAELKLKIASQSQKREGSQGESPSKKEQELSSLVEHINRQLEQAEHAKRQLSIDVERLTAQKKRSEQDVATLRKEMEEYKERAEREMERLKEEKKQLGKQNAQLQQNYARLEIEARGTSGLLGVVPPVVSEPKGLSLKEQQDKYKSSPPQQQDQEQTSRVPVDLQQGSSVPQDECATLAVNLKAYEETLHQMNASFERETERFSSLDSWLKVTTEKLTRNTNDPQVVRDLKADLQQVKRLLTQEQASNEEKKQMLAGAQVQFQKLFSDYRVLLQEWDLFHEDRCNKERQSDTYHELQARGFSEKIDSMTAQLLTKDEAIKLKTQEMDKLLDKLKKLELENEAISILKAQVEVYQSDFNAEREAREHLAGEKERLAEDLRHLQRRNQQLLEDLEAYQQNHFDQVQNQQSTQSIAVPRRGNSPNPQVRQPSPRESWESQENQPRENEPQETVENETVFEEENTALVRYFCPKCNIGFRELQPLEYHVETCLELTN